MMSRPWRTVLMMGMVATVAHSPLIDGPLVRFAACQEPVVGTMRASTERTSSPLRPLDTKGYTAMIAAHHGHVVIVDFWATWCAPCREEMPGLIALVGQHSKNAVQLVTVSADMTEQLHDAEQFLDSVRAPAARYIKQTDDDDRFIQSVDSTWTGALPAIFVYDREGRKVRAFFGETSVDSVTAAVKTALDH